MTPYGKTLRRGSANLVLLFALSPLDAHTATCAATPGTASRNPAQKLALARALPVEGVRDPSGLVVRDGDLYGVSDKVDDVIWRVELRSDRAVFREHLKFQCRELNGKRLDLEGISVDASGQFYVLSEMQFAIIRVTSEGRASLVDAFEQEGKRSGLFAKNGAGPEGLLWLGGRFLVAAEREPAGLLEINVARSPRRRVFLESGQIPIRPDRPADITGLCAFRDQIWCLTRNAESIVRVELGDAGAWTTREVFSFADVVSQPRLAYVDMRFGHAEGLTMDERFIYIILDNNDSPRRDDPTDRRPRLLIFRQPHNDSPSRS